MNCLILETHALCVFVLFIDMTCSVNSYIRKNFYTIIQKLDYSYSTNKLNKTWKTINLHVFVFEIDCLNCATVSDLYFRHRRTYNSAMSIVLILPASVSVTELEYDYDSVSPVFCSTRKSPSVLYGALVDQGSGWNVTSEQPSRDVGSDTDSRVF